MIPENKNIFKIYYHPELVKILYKTSKLAGVAVNILAPIATIMVVHNFIESSILILWFSLHLVALVFRIVLIDNFNICTKKKNCNYRLYAHLQFGVVFFNFLLSLSLIVYSIYVGVEDINIIVVLSIVFAVVSGSIVMISSIFLLFLFFVSINISMIVSAALYVGGDLFAAFAYVLTASSFMFIRTGWQQYNIYIETLLLERKYENIYQKATDGILLIDKYSMVDCNESMLTMFGYSDKEIFLKKTIPCISSEYQIDGALSSEKFVHMIDLAFKNGSHSFEWIHKQDNDENFWCEIVLTRIEEFDKYLIHAVVRDIDKRKKDELKYIKLQETLESRVAFEVEKNQDKDKQLIHQSRLAQMGEMISMIAHQWRQPLSSISATSASLIIRSELDTLDSEIVADHASKISEYSQYLSSTIDDFRNFFKTNKDVTETSFKELVESVLKIVGVSIQNKNISVVKSYSENKLFYTHSNEIKHVILNLIKNAEDILLEREIVNPKIYISSYNEDEQFILKISDNGGGVSDKIKDNIFDPYFSTKRKKDGTGLGLYMSRTIIEKHCNGKLDMHNSDEGAVFTISVTHISDNSRRNQNQKALT